MKKIINNTQQLFNKLKFEPNLLKKSQRKFLHDQGYLIIKKISLY